MVVENAERAEVEQDLFTRGVARPCWAAVELVLPRLLCWDEVVE